MAMPVAWASPKSLYLIADHHTAQFDAWLIQPGCTATYQASYGLTTHIDPADVAIDDGSCVLFVTAEFTAGIEMIDAYTMTYIGTTGAVSNLAGIDVDDPNDIVYALERSSNQLYAYDWVPPNTLTLRAGFPVTLQNCVGGYGIALDNYTNTLWVADAWGLMARAYDTTQAPGVWNEDVAQSFQPTIVPVDIAVDRIRGFVYTVSTDYGFEFVPGAGSNLISQWDLATTTEYTHNMGQWGVGVAVDEDTGCVYVTLAPVPTFPGDLGVWDPSTWTQTLYTPLSGSPAGICVPRGECQFIVEPPVGGIWAPVNVLELLAPWIAVTLIALAAAAAGTRHFMMKRW